MLGQGQGKKVFFLSFSLAHPSFSQDAVALQEDLLSLPPFFGFCFCPLFPLSSSFSSPFLSLFSFFLFLGLASSSYLLPPSFAFFRRPSLLRSPATSALPFSLRLSSTSAPLLSLFLCLFTPCSLWLLLLVSCLPFSSALLPFSFLHSPASLPSRLVKHVPPVTSLRPSFLFLAVSSVSSLPWPARTRSSLGCWWRRP